MKKLLIPLLIFFLLVVVYSFSHTTKLGDYANKNNTVQDMQEKSCSTHSDCTDEFQQPNKFYGCFNNKCQTVAIGTCLKPEDCQSQPLAVVQCVGKWTCEKSASAQTGKCNWVCQQG